VSALFTQSPGDTVQTGPEKVDPARKFKCTSAARETKTLKLRNCFKFYFKFRKPSVGPVSNLDMSGDYYGTTVEDITILPSGRTSK